MKRQKKSIRAQQLRDAQRRRRAKLKSESKSYLQLIVPDDLYDRLKKHAEQTEQNLQEAVLQLIQKALSEDVSPITKVNRRFEVSDAKITEKSIVPKKNQLEFF